MSRLFRSGFVQALIIALAVVMALAIGFATPAFASGPMQATPVENSIVPGLLQIALIVLVTEGIKSLLAAFTNGKTALAGREAAIAYVVVGMAVYLIQFYLLPALPANVSAALTDILSFGAVLLAGSGLFSMTRAFRIQQK